MLMQALHATLEQLSGDPHEPCNMLVAIKVRCKQTPCLAAGLAGWLGSGRGLHGKGAVLAQDWLGKHICCKQTGEG